MEKRNGKENLRDTSYIMSTVLTTTCSCVSKVHLYCSGQVTKAFYLFFCPILSCVHFVPSGFRATDHAGQSKMATCVPAVRTCVLPVCGN